MSKKIRMVRRSMSFPENEEMQEWFDNQTHVNYSVYAIIQHTISQYGTGDLMDALLQVANKKMHSPQQTSSMYQEDVPHVDVPPNDVPPATPPVAPPATPPATPPPVLSHEDEMSMQIPMNSFGGPVVTQPAQNKGLADLKNRFGNQF